jgi:hypothetical protein
LTCAAAVASFVAKGKDTMRHNKTNSRKLLMKLPILAGLLLLSAPVFARGGEGRGGEGGRAMVGEHGMRGGEGFREGGRFRGFEGRERMIQPFRPLNPVFMAPRPIDRDDWMWMPGRFSDDGFWNPGFFRPLRDRD